LIVNTPWVVSELTWNGQDAARGKLIKIHGFPGALKVKSLLKKNIYSIEKRMLSNYMKQELIRPSAPMAFV